LAAHPNGFVELFQADARKSSTPQTTSQWMIFANLSSMERKKTTSVIATEMTLATQK
jgi:hypothetical protein